MPATDLFLCSLASWHLIIDFGYKMTTIYVLLEVGINKKKLYFIVLWIFFVSQPSIPGHFFQFDRSLKTIFWSHYFFTKKWPHATFFKIQIFSWDCWVFEMKIVLIWIWANELILGKKNSYLNGRFLVLVCYAFYVVIFILDSFQSNVPMDLKKKYMSILFIRALLMTF